ncbi:MAG: translation initiation factor IF-2 [Dehalococcoidia bacterium]
MAEVRTRGVETPTAPRTIELARALTVKELADSLRVTPVDVIKELMKNGVMASINQVIDYDTASIVASDFGVETVEAAAAEPEYVEPKASRSMRFVETEGAELVTRPPVVTIMGHVDHGKTSLLDALRETNVTAGEAGGITQHIGAYQVELNGQRITFLDTPGHEAFTAMRARGAQATDVAVLVVAADDGVMPQTAEAIDHIKAAEVPMVVAINKIDLPSANIDRVKGELAQRGVIIEEYGGETICVPVSARTKEGLSNLLESILIQSEVLDLKANPERDAVGLVVEAEMDQQRGPVATVLVQTGTLQLGDAVIVGQTWGKIKAMFDDKGRRIKSAGPSMPAKLLGLSGIAAAGDPMRVVRDSRLARDEVDQAERQREALAAQRSHGVTLDNLFGEISAGKIKELNLILKTDVQGSIEPIRTSLERLSTEQVKVKIIHSGSGSITETDVMLAIASKGIVIGFNSRPEPGAKRQSELEGVDIRYYDVIYSLVEDIDKALKGMLDPVFVEVIDGHAEVRQIIKISRIGNIAGSYVTDGQVRRGDQVRARRGTEQLWQGRVANLKRFKEDVREVQAGYECGVTLDGFDDFRIGDTMEFFHRERES